jgi:ABC-type transport system involved in cytochrome bd biosynthesis fused ATPase/permease subunit
MQAFQVNASNANREVSMTQGASSPFRRQTPQLSELLDKTAGIISDLGLQFTHYSQGLNDLASRYCEGRIHLAVLGQFKRGKSTLLNRLDETVAATQGAMQAAHTRRQDGDGSIEADASRMSDRMSALEVVKIELTVLRNGISPSSEPKTDGRMQSMVGS